MLSGILGTGYDTRQFSNPFSFAYQRTKDELVLPYEYHAGHVLGNAVIAPFMFSFYLCESIKWKRESAKWKRTNALERKRSSTIDDRV